MESARVKLRGIYAIVAGVLWLLVIPYYQGSILDPQGYTMAIRPISARRDFAPLLHWIAQHAGADRGARLLGIVPYLLAITLPPALLRALGRVGGRRAPLPRIAGQLGFGLFVVVGAAGVLSSAATGARYATATTATARASAVHTFATSYTVETVLARGCGGLLLALFLGLVSAYALAPTSASAGSSSNSLRALPAWIGYFGLLVAALEVATALLALVAPTQVDAPFAPLAYFALALWLLAVGVSLARLRALPEDEGMPITPAVVGDSRNDSARDPEQDAPLPEAGDANTP